MTGTKLQAMSTNELVDRFTRLALQQDEAELAFDVKEGNRLYWMLKKVEGELKSRPGDQRHALLPLLDHSNPQVQIKAAKATLAIAPAAARHVLEVIAETCYGPQKLEAGMSLVNLDRGIYKPT
jgi:cytochrome c oxidase assembly protein Cox11